MKNAKCEACSGTMSIGRSMLLCSECSISAHTYCAKKVPNTCGLPKMFAKHYMDSLEPKKEDNLAEAAKVDEVVNVEGWIKIPG